jgi:predicted transcriptional regulator YdeE/uncharacterized damage-inducible protein DinB
MEIFNLENDLQVFGIRVSNFPAGIGEAFERLVNTLPEGQDRSYYGICEMTDEGLVYKATAFEQQAGEAEKYNMERSSIQKGKYAVVKLKDWRKQTDKIKNVFCEMMQDECIDKTSPSIEWYADDDEMWCMLKIDTRKDLQNEFDMATDELVQMISHLTDEQLNTIPFEGSWTAGQVAAHLIKVNEGFAQLLQGPAKETLRPADEMVTTIKRDFLDFTIKMIAPDFVVPENRTYKKEALLNSFEEIETAIKKLIQTSDLTETCLLFELPVYGYVTRLEAVYFVIYHALRHIKQLKNITLKLGKEATAIL